MKMVYIVTDGDYSDYCILSVYEEKKDAEAFIKAYHRDEAQIEEWPLNKFDPQRLFWRVLISKDGMATAYLWRWNIDERVEMHFWSLDGPKKLEVFCYAKNKDHAIKIANEKRREWIAAGQW